MSQKDLQYRSDALAAIHETMRGLHNIAAISELTMHKFDALCLVSATADDSNVAHPKDVKPLE